MMTDHERRLATLEEWAKHHSRRLDDFMDGQEKRAEKLDIKMDAVYEAFISARGGRKMLAAWIVAAGAAGSFLPWLLSLFQFKH